MNPLPSASQGYTALTSDGLLLKRIIKPSTSEEEPESGNKVHVHYDGTLWNDAQTPFDSSRNRPGDFSFTLGNGQVIRGWDIGVASMKKGEICELICSHEYAYGDQGSPPAIPCKATLKFVVELLHFYREPSTDSERLQTAQEEKEKGNQFFSLGQYALAIQSYGKGYEFAKKVADKSQSAGVLCSLLLNLMAANNKSSHFSASLEHAQVLASLMPSCRENPKYLFRLGVAQHGLGQLAEALQTLTDAKCSSPSSDSGIEQEIVQVKKSIKVMEDKERSTFGKLFL